MTATKIKYIVKQLNDAVNGNSIYTREQITQKIKYTDLPKWADIRKSMDYFNGFSEKQIAFILFLDHPILKLQDEIILPFFCDEENYNFFDNEIGNGEYHLSYRDERRVNDILYTIFTRRVFTPEWHKSGIYIAHSKWFYEKHKIYFDGNVNKQITTP